MKRLLWSLVAVIATISVYAQEPDVTEPTTLKDLNLKGNVGAVLTNWSEYKDYFGEITEGDVYRTTALFFDEKGRSILRRIISRGDGKQTALGLIVFNYEDGDETIIKKMKYSTFAYSSLYDYDYCYQKLGLGDSSFEELMESTEQPLNSPFPEEYVYDNNGIIITHTIYDQRGKEIKINAKEIGKATETSGVYDFVDYHYQGKSYDKSQRTYKEGVLVKVDREVGRKAPVQDHLYSIKTPETGTYKYDKDGRLISFISLYKSSYNVSIYNETKYEYNSHGDLVKEMYRRGSCDSTKQEKWGEWSSSKWHYDDYKYDEHGNWISRTFWRGETPEFIQKRKIAYRE